MRQPDADLPLPTLGTTPVDAHFQPLFLYESISGAIGAIVLLYVARRVRWLRPGDVVLLFFVWYGTTRFLLEPLRSNNWTFFGVPVASIISAATVIGALLLFAWRHRPGATAGDVAEVPASGAPPTEESPTATAPDATAGTFSVTDGSVAPDAAASPSPAAEGSAAPDAIASPSPGADPARSAASGADASATPPSAAEGQATQDAATSPSAGADGSAAPGAAATPSPGSDASAAPQPE